MSKYGSSHTHNFVSDWSQNTSSLRSFTLKNRQQPIYTRVSTSNERDRRTLDPPPIIQVRLQGGTLQETQTLLQSPSLFMCANLTHSEDNNEVYTPNHNALSGQAVSSLYKLKDIDNNDGGFFIFGDLSVKVEGRYRLKFTLFEITNAGAVAGQVIFSNPFVVHSTRTFPGVLDSTFLSRTFSDQGARIRIRKEQRTQVLGLRKRDYPVDLKRVETSKVQDDSFPVSDSNSILLHSNPHAAASTSDPSPDFDLDTSRKRLHISKDTAIATIPTHVKSLAYSVTVTSSPFTPVASQSHIVENDPSNTKISQKHTIFHGRRASSSSSSGTESICSEKSFAPIYVAFHPSKPISYESYYPTPTISPSPQPCDYHKLSKEKQLISPKNTPCQSIQNVNPTPETSALFSPLSLYKNTQKTVNETFIRLPPLRYMIDQSSLHFPSLNTREDTQKLNPTNTMPHSINALKNIHNPQPVDPTYHTYPTIYTTPSFAL